MGWKRITNKKKNDKRAIPPLTCELLEEYLESMTTALNFRLLCEENGLHPDQNLLWVENIDILSYEPRDNPEKRPLFAVLAQRIRQAAELMKQCLTELWGRTSSSH